MCPARMNGSEDVLGGSQLYRGTCAPLISSNLAAHHHRRSSNSSRESVKSTDSLQVFVIDYTIREATFPYAVFTIVVRKGQLGQTQVLRRYNDFVELRSLLAISFPSALIAGIKLPQKRWWKRNKFDPVFMESRREGLEVFLRQIVTSPLLFSVQVVQDFLSSNWKKLPPMKPRQMKLPLSGSPSRIISSIARIDSCKNQLNNGNEEIHRKTCNSSKINEIVNRSARASAPLSHTKQNSISTDIANDADGASGNATDVVNVNISTSNLGSGEQQEIEQVSPPNHLSTQDSPPNTYQQSRTHSNTVQEMNDSIHSSNHLVTNATPNSVNDTAKPPSPTALAVSGFLALFTKDKSKEKEITPTVADSNSTSSEDGSIGGELSTVDEAHKPMAHSQLTPPKRSMMLSGFLQPALRYRSSSPTRSPRLGGNPHRQSSYDATTSKSSLKGAPRTSSDTSHQQQLTYKNVRRWQPTRFRKLPIPPNLTSFLAHPIYVAINPKVLSLRRQFDTEKVSVTFGTPAQGFTSQQGDGPNSPCLPITQPPDGFFDDVFPTTDVIVKQKNFQKEYYSRRFKKMKNHKNPFKPNIATGRNDRVGL